MRNEKMVPGWVRTLASAQCLACAGPLAPFGPRLSYLYAECTSCGSLQLSPVPDEVPLAHAYQEAYTDAVHTEEFSDPDAWAFAGQPYRADLLQAVRDHHTDGRIIDVGAGWGHLCAQIRDAGFDCVGVEPSTTMAAHARAKGLPITPGTLEDLSLERGSVSTLLLCAVLEHLVNHASFLSQAADILRVGGLLITLQPTAAAYRLAALMLRFGNRARELPELHGTFAPPWHTAILSIEGIRHLGDRAGFDLIDVRAVSPGRSPGLTGIVQWVMRMVNGVGTRLAGGRWPLVTTHICVLRKRPPSA